MIINYIIITTLLIILLQAISKIVDFTTYIFSRTIPLAWEAPEKGLALRAVPKWDFLYDLSAHLLILLVFASLRPALNPLGFLLIWIAKIRSKR